MKTRNIKTHPATLSFRFPPQGGGLRWNLAFTFVELIVSIGIILLISTVGYMSYSGNLQTKDNAKVVSDISTIDNAFRSYMQSNKSLPEANGNKSFYKADGSYAHDETDSAYGVSSFVSEKTLNQKFLNSIPLDPRTGYYYAYAKTINNKYYEIAGVEKKDNNYKSIVKGDYPVNGNELMNLVKEYNGPDFVGNNSTTHFPYNPEEKVLTASINDYSGSISVVHNGTTFTGTSVFDLSLVTGDKITIGTGGTANIYFSDASKSYLGDSNKSSELVLANMEYVEDSNLFTKVKLVLNVGTIWTAASKMSENSDFEVYSNDTVAAVRGTIFGVTNINTGATNIVLARGDIEVAKVNLSGNELINSLENNDTSLRFTPINQPSSVVSSTGHIIVAEGGNPEGIQVNTTTPTGGTYTTDLLTGTTLSGAINSIPGTPEEKSAILEGGNDGNEQDTFLDVQELSNSGTNANDFSKVKIKVKITKEIAKKFKYFKVNGEYKARFDTLGITSTTTSYTLTGGTSFSGSTIRELDNDDKTLPTIAESVSNLPLSDILNTSSGKLDLVFCKKTNKGEKCSKSMQFVVAEKTAYTGICQNKSVELGGEKVDNLLCDKGYDLVAYAGYDNFGKSNTVITASGMLGLFSLNGNNLFKNQQYIFGNSWIPKYQSGVFLNDKNSYCKGDMSCISSYINVLNNNGFLYNKSDKNNIFKQINSGIEGFFIDSPDDDNYLQYNILDLKLSGSDFAIEMSVRGAALKRNSGKYVLFDIPGVRGGNGLRLNIQYEYVSDIGMYKNKIVLGTHSNLSNNQEQIIITNPDDIENDKFYKIILKYDNNQPKIYLYDGNTKKLESNISSIGTTYQTPGALNDLYIGSYFDSSSYIGQWNDIIDYVKIYKR